MLKNQKHVFWEALLLAIFIFASGMLIGYLLELNRTSNIISAYQEAEINLLDIKIQQTIFEQEDFNCEEATQELIKFADKTYLEASILEEYKKSARLSEGIFFQHKKYDLLRTILWLNSIKVKEICPNSFDTIVYFYEYSPTDLDDLNLRAKQEAFSRSLGELKYNQEDGIILIPIAGNLDIGSIELLKSNYNIDKLPTVLINEKQVITSIDELESIESYL